MLKKREGKSCLLFCRDETYLCFIKQVNENPEPEAVAQAWSLLALCLTVFPPSPEFEDYLERFVRDHPDVSSLYYLVFLGGGV